MNLGGHGSQVTPAHPLRGVVAVSPEEAWFQHSLSPAERCHVGIKKSFKVSEPVLLFSWAPGVRESIERRVFKNPFILFARDSPVAQLVKNLPAMQETLVYLGLIPGSGRFAGEGIGYPLQYPGQENAMDCTWRHMGSVGPMGSQRVGLTE